MVDATKFTRAARVQQSEAVSRKTLTLTIPPDLAERMDKVDRDHDVGWQDLLRATLDRSCTQLEAIALD